MPFHIASQHSILISNTVVHPTYNNMQASCCSTVIMALAVCAGYDAKVEEAFQAVTMLS